VHAKDVV
jgi:dynein heavy chain